jgi:pimeloyl-ACP methyl ester carboxylesterase
MPTQPTQPTQLTAPTDAAGPREWRATTRDGVRLAGDDQGPPDAAPIVLLHGLSSNRRWWNPVAARLAHQHRVVRYDHRGHGRSDDGPIRGYTVEQLAADTIEVLNHLGLERVLLAGHSAGADIAVTVAAAHPDRVTALALVDGGVYDPRLMFGTTWPTARPHMVGARRAPTTNAVLAAWLADNSTLPRDALPAVLGNYTDNGHGRLHPRPSHKVREHLAHSLWQRDPTAALAAIDAPVLVLAAQTTDTTANQHRHESIRRARNRLGDSPHVKWIPGGHDLPLVQPALVADALVDLAARIGSWARCSISSRAP